MPERCYASGQDVVNAPQKWTNGRRSLSDFASPRGIASVAKLPPFLSSLSLTAFFSSLLSTFLLWTARTACARGVPFHLAEITYNIARTDARRRIVFVYILLNRVASSVLRRKTQTTTTTSCVILTRASNVDGRKILKVAKIYVSTLRAHVRAASSPFSVRAHGKRSLPHAWNYV